MDKKLINGAVARANILIFCPSLANHRQNYVYMIANCFLSMGYNIILAAGENGDIDRIINYPLIQQLIANHRVKFINLGDTNKSHEIPSRWINVVLELEKEYSPVLTMFPTADEMLISLDGLGKAARAKPLYRAGIFIKTNYFYRRNYSREKFILKPRRFLGCLLNLIKEHFYLNYQVWGRLGLDSAFTINPDFMKIACSKFRYLPDIYRAWNDEIGIFADEIDFLCGKYNAFLKNHTDKNVILYYGGRTMRRGYDTLIRLACDDPDSVFVSVGRDADRTVRDLNEMKNSLANQGRILEMEIPFYPDNKLVDLLYRTCKFVVLPYSNFYGVSGTMIQATTYGKPVIVSNFGYINSMVNKHGIGVTYIENDYEDLLRKYQYMKVNYRKFTEPVQNFSKMHGLSPITKSLTTFIENIQSTMELAT